MFNAKRADLARPHRGRLAARSSGVELTLQLAGASAPTLHRFAGRTDRGALDAVVRGLTDLSPKPWADRFREMQAAGGGIEIKSLRLAQADAIVVGSRNAQRQRERQA